MYGCVNEDILYDVSIDSNTKCMVKAELSYFAEHIEFIYLSHRENARLGYIDKIGRI